MKKLIGKIGATGRLWILFLMLVSMFGMMLFAPRNWEPRMLIVLGGFSVVVGTGILFFRYEILDDHGQGLRSEPKENFIDLKRLVQNRHIGNVDLAGLLQRIGADYITIGDKEATFEQIVEAIGGADLKKQKVKPSLNLKVDWEVQNAVSGNLDTLVIERIVAIHPIYKSGLNRLVRSKDAAEGRGLVNLRYGVMGAIVGLGILGYRALTIQMAEGESFFLQLLPSLTLGVLMEVLAFFFLRLYSKSLEESKYYANEITILEARFLGYFMATIHGDEEERKEIVLEFGKYMRELPTLRSTPVIDKATTGALIDLVKSVATSTKGGQP